MVLRAGGAKRPLLVGASIAWCRHRLVARSGVATTAEQLATYEETPLFFMSAFPMFVPSLSW